MKRLAPLLAAGISIATGCKKTETETQKSPAQSDQAGNVAPAAKPTPVAAPSGPKGVVQGRVTLAGTAPEMPELQRGSDPFCGKTPMKAETVLVGEGGGLQNVLVRVKPKTVPAFTPTTPVKVDQDNCMYRPRVQGAVVGQTLELQNSDETSHNVNARKVTWGERQDLETIFNRGQPKGSPALRSEIEPDIDILKLKCDQHGWMQGYVVISDNPYWTTSDDKGNYQLKDVPAGPLEIQAWHEFYGVKTQTVNVVEGKPLVLDFGFDAERDKPGSAPGAATAAPPASPAAAVESAQNPLVNPPGKKGP